MKNESAWQKWGVGNPPTFDDLPIEWCNVKTGERHTVYNEGGLIRTIKKHGNSITHWRKVEPPMPLPEPDEI